MFIYTLRVSFASSDLEFDNKMIEALDRAVAKANGSFTAVRRNIRWEIGTLSKDRRAAEVVLRSPEPISSPTRSLSGLSRALLDTTDLLDGNTPNGRVFFAKVVAEEKDNLRDLKPGEAAKTVIEILFEQDSLSSVNKKLAQKTAAKLKEVLLEYLNEKVL